MRKIALLALFTLPLLFDPSTVLAQKPEKPKSRSYQILVRKNGKWEPIRMFFDNPTQSHVCQEFPYFPPEEVEIILNRLDAEEGIDDLTRMKAFAVFPAQADTMDPYVLTLGLYRQGVHIDTIQVDLEGGYRPSVVEPGTGRKIIRWSRPDAARIYTALSTTLKKRGFGDQEVNHFVAGVWSGLVEASSYGTPQTKEDPDPPCGTCKSGKHPCSDPRECPTCDLGATGNRPSCLFCTYCS